MAMQTQFAVMAHAQAQAESSKTTEIATFETLLKRLKYDPPPWTDRNAMAQWLSVYGGPDPGDPKACSSWIMMLSPATLPGFSTLNTRLQGVCEPSGVGPVASMLLQADEGLDGNGGASRPDSGFGAEE
jgi:hypothetical protein